MLKRLSLLAMVGAIFVVGCKSDHDSMKHDGMAMKDDCSHCEGVQHATADGKCPVCGMAMMDKK